MNFLLYKDIIENPRRVFWRKEKEITLFLRVAGFCRDKIEGNSFLRFLKKSPLSHPKNCRVIALNLRVVFGVIVAINNDLVSRQFSISEREIVRQDPCGHLIQSSQRYVRYSNTLSINIYHACISRCDLRLIWN